MSYLTRESCEGEEYGAFPENIGHSFVPAFGQGGLSPGPCPTLRCVSTYHLPRHGDTKRIGSTRVCRKGTRGRFPPPRGLFSATRHVLKGRSGVTTIECDAAAQSA